MCFNRQQVSDSHKFLPQLITVFTVFALSIIIAIIIAQASYAQDITIASGAVGRDLEELRGDLESFREKTGYTASIVSMPQSSTDQFGQYKLWLASKNADVAIYRTDIIWAPQLANHLVDLTDYTKDIVDQHFPSIIASQTVNGKLVALPMFTDAPALFYRKDLLQKYNKQVPQTWSELTTIAKDIMSKEREAGNKNIWGYVFQGSAYEGLTCNALEWISSFNGGAIVDDDGKITINNPNTIKAINVAASWIGTIAPRGVLAYKEEEARGIWQTGNAVFMRNWPYAYSLSDSADSEVKGKFSVVKLPSGDVEGGHSAATLGGWNLAVSKYSRNIEGAVALVKYLASPEVQKARALKNSRLPTIKALYDDAQIIAKRPFIVKWKSVFLNSIPRPSAITKRKYNEVSKEFWTAVHDTLSGSGTAEKNMKKLEIRLKRLRGRGW